MIPVSAWVALLMSLGLLWQESGEDLGVFCYRMGCRVFTFARKRALELVPVRHRTNGNVARTVTACSNRFFTFSNRSMIRRDYES